MVTMTKRQMVDISGLSKAVVLAALFNASRPTGPYGDARAKEGPRVMSVSHAQTLIDGGNVATPDYHGKPIPEHPKLYFGYVYGRLIKVDLSNDSTLNPLSFDEYHGVGKAQRIIDQIRAQDNS